MVLSRSDKRMYNYMSTMLMLIIVVFSLIDLTTPVEVHFENKDAGFFLKQSPRQQHFMGGGTAVVLPELSGVNTASAAAAAAAGASTAEMASLLESGSGPVLSTDRFTVLQSSQPISVRATYGPFSTKQTVPARYVVNDPIPVNLTDLHDMVHNHFDMSAHIVRSDIPRDSPVLRVLFHAGVEPGSTRRHPLLYSHAPGVQTVPLTHVCIIVRAQLSTHNHPLQTSCAPSSEEGVCVAQITMPSSWWPPLPPPDKHGRFTKPPKTPPRIVRVSYSVIEPNAAEPHSGVCRTTTQDYVPPDIPLGSVPLVQAKGSYKELRLADGLIMMIPHPSLYPKSQLYLPVFMDKHRAKMTTALVIRGRVKSGVRILDATPTASCISHWNMTVDINSRHTTASVTLIRRASPDPDPASDSESADATELFTWLIEVGDEDSMESYEGAKAVWTARFEPAITSVLSTSTKRSSNSMATGSVAHNLNNQEHSMVPESGRKSVARFDIQKDDIQAVVPISKNWELLNTAVLTGRQVSQALKIFIVSQAGKAADVTFQASCHSEDDSVLKVSTSCSSVYVDGSESRGSANGSVLVKYGAYSGLARFSVWMPEFPLDVQVADSRLSQLKGWRVPDTTPMAHKRYRRRRRRRRRYASNSWTSTGNSEMSTNSVVSSEQQRTTMTGCKIRYQQSPVDVYAHFMAMDHDSGRISYFVNRRTWLRVTDLVLPLLRVSDPRIATLHGRILQGRTMGRAEVQVLSPISGRVIGAREVRVSNDKVSINKMFVQVISGLQLNINVDPNIENGYVAETSISRRLTVQYQEGLLDISLEFSDGSRTPLREIPNSDYRLIVESLDSEIVAFAPSVASRHPRVIAVGEGRGDLLQVSLMANDECRHLVTHSRNTVGSSTSKSNNQPSATVTTAGPLASASANVVVDFSSMDTQRPDLLQNDGGGGGSSSSSLFGGSTGHHKGMSDLQDILKGGVHHKKNEEPNVQARQYHGSGKQNRYGHGGATMHVHDLTPLEIGMYVLLAAFCCAIVVFVISCVVYASKFKPLSTEGAVHAGLRASPVPAATHARKPATTNAHDWVWLGRSTIDTTSIANNRQSLIPNTTTANDTNGVGGTVGVGVVNNMTPLNRHSNHITSDLMRITTNPLSQNYCEPEDCLIATEAPSVVPFDTRTYCKGARRLTDNWSRPVPPPPLPPHGKIVPAPETDTTAKNQVDEDYRPPVPPHRNVMSSLTAISNQTHHSPAVHSEINAASAALAKSNNWNQPNPHHHHHHHHHRHRHHHHRHNHQHHQHSDLSSTTRPTILSELVVSYSNEADHETISPTAVSTMTDEPDLGQQQSHLENLLANADGTHMRKAFEFDDDHEINAVDDECGVFIKCQPTKQHASAALNEVRQATIVGNSMFHSERQADDATSPIPDSANDSNMVALENLQLDMNYEQILQYFENLKESNA